LEREGRPRAKRPRRATAGVVLGLIGGVGALVLRIIVPIGVSLILAGVLGGGAFALLLGFLMLFALPFIALATSIAGSVLILKRRYRVGGFVNIAGSLTILVPYVAVLAIAAAPISTVVNTALGLLLLWGWPGILLLASGLLGLRSGKAEARPAAGWEEQLAAPQPPPPGFVWAPAQTEKPSPQQPPGEGYCRSCGARLLPGARYCSSCGRKAKD